MKVLISRTTLTDVVAAKLAHAILQGSYPAGSQLPSERELTQTFGVSRVTLREALHTLEESGLLESRQGAGWFVHEVDQSNLARARELSARETEPERPAQEKRPGQLPNGPRRLPVAPEKPLLVPNLKTDRMGTFELISWWERKKVTAAKVLVVGAGALGNEVLKNLALMGIGHIFVTDFDSIELANLSRSVLFREADTGRSKAEVAAARIKDLNPEVQVQYHDGDVTTSLGLGIFRRMDVVIGCLDNREARLAVNRFCYWVNKPWIDGALQEFLGLMRVFVPGQGACFECTLTEQARRDLALRYSCPLLARENVLLGKVPTTPTVASIIAAMQAQEALKLIHDLPVEPGRVVHYNGMTNEMRSTSYKARPDCESHWVYGAVTELPITASATSLQEMLRIARTDLGDEAVLELDQELVLSLRCLRCGTTEQVLKPISEVGFKSAHCPVCNSLRETELTHTITGREDFLQRTLTSIGVPPLHVLRACNSREYRFYELTGDLQQALHFQDFCGPVSKLETGADRIHLGKEIHPPSQKSPNRSNHIVLSNEEGE
jgi:molybdopterin/thiamine biosynthesis adenylyltransferase/DNA-binding transcriptional regulator YhcF (GntR family)